MTTVWSALAGGFLGTLVMTTVLSAASAFGLTRMDLPFLLGTAFTDNRRRAKVWGFVLQFILGLIFALGYAALFAALGRSGWAIGALFGVVHAGFVGTVLVNVILPIIHPRIGTPESAANEIALLEAPGFLLLNYGRRTFALTLAAHVAFGAIVGWAVRL